MSWCFSQALVEAFSQATSSETPACAQLNVMPTPSPFSRNDKTIEPSRLSRFGVTFALLTDDHGEALLRWYRVASLARTSASPAMETDSRESAAACGENLPAWFARWSPNGCEWKTAQCSLLEDSESYSETWPRSGLMLGGTCYPQRTLAPLTFETASGSWPTPTVYGNSNAPKEGTKRGTGLSTAVKQWPTPVASLWKAGARPEGRTGGQGMNLREAVERFPTVLNRDYRHPPAASYADRGGGAKGDQLPYVIGGPLNPMWVEWLMGWPIGWTALNALAMDKYREWQQQHLLCWQPN